MTNLHSLGGELVLHWMSLCFICKKWNQSACTLQNMLAVYPRHTKALTDWQPFLSTCPRLVGPGIIVQFWRQPWGTQAKNNNKKPHFGTLELRHSYYLLRPGLRMDDFWRGTCSFSLPRDEHVTSRWWTTLNVDVRITAWKIWVVTVRFLEFFKKQNNWLFLANGK